MSNSYKYIDPDNEYTDENGILRNLLEITDEEVLLFTESGLVAKKLQELYENPIKIEGWIVSLKFINTYLKKYIFGLGKVELWK